MYQCLNIHCYIYLAMAEAYLAEKSNTPNYSIVDHYTYAIAGDGCLMEGISGEASSLAETLGLGKLIVLYDSNNISIEGSTDIAFREDVAKRYEAYGWQVLKIADGNDINSIESAIEEAKEETSKPSIIIVKNQIGFGCPAKQGKASAHGEPLGAENIKAMKENLGWKIEPEFYVPDEVYSNMNKYIEKGISKEETWKNLFKKYEKAYPELAKEYTKWMSGEIDKDAFLMKLPVTYVLTHDSIGVGEDGPTHEPIEQLAALRSMPNMTVFRPADSKETAAAWYYAVTNGTTPTSLVLTRQKLPLYGGCPKRALKGGYILKDSKKETPDVLLMASGSEVELIYKAADELEAKGIDARVISIPSFEVFEAQDQAYKESVMPNKVRARVAVEALTSFGWHKYVGLDGEIISLDTFGASGKAEQLFKQFGFTVENVVDKALKVVGK